MCFSENNFSENKIKLENHGIGHNNSNSSIFQYLKICHFFSSSPYGTQAVKENSSGDFFFLSFLSLFKNAIIRSKFVLLLKQVPFLAKAPGISSSQKLLWGLNQVRPANQCSWKWSKTRSSWLNSQIWLPEDSSLRERAGAQRLLAACTWDSLRQLQSYSRLFIQTLTQVCRDSSLEKHKSHWLSKT